MSTNAHSSHLNDGAKNRIGRNFQCRECHSATASSTTDWQLTSTTYHVNQQVNIKFYGAANLNRDTDNPTYQGLPTTVASGASVTTGVGNNQCSNVYCHSLGNIDFTTKNVITAGVYSFSTPTWGGAALTCDACHGDKAGKAYPVYASGGSGAENSHVAHVATNGYTCNLCHVTTTASTTITAATMTIVPNGTHLNRVEDVAFATYFSRTGAYNGANKTCSATYCHGSGTPQWGNAAAVTCGSCHLGASDTNDFTYNNGSLAVISQMEWTTSGHGRTGTPYSVTNNTAANLPTAAGTGDPCLYCHDDNAGHQNTPNFFRLRSFASGTNGNQVCWNCHGTGSAGVNPQSGTSTTVTAATKVDKYHYGGQHASTLNGGQFCWDCHEPHGDRTAGALGPIAMIQSRPAMSSDPITGKPATIVSTTVTFTSNNSGASYGAATAPYDRICNVCHTYSPTGANKMVHYATNTSDGHNQSQVCTTCHQHSGNTTKDGEAFKGGACDGCHAYPPKGGDGMPYMLVNGATPTANEGKGGWVSGPTFSGGHKAHVDHLVSLSGYTLDAANDSFVSAKTAILCGTCHDMNANNHSTSGNGTRLINFNSSQTYSFGTTAPTYNGIPGVPSSTRAKTCSNVSCHFQDAPRWQDPAVTN
jgi:predicted CxxxxCH...CXXCH cytochrome family protein